MAWDLTTQLFSYMDDVTTTFVSSNLSKVIAFASPTVAILLTMSIMVNSVYSMYGSGPPLWDETKRFFRYAMIISVASAGGWFQTTLADTAIKLPDEFARTLVLGAESSTDDGTVAGTIDRVVDKGIQVFKKAMDNAGLSATGAVSVILGCVVLIATVLVAAIGTALVLMAKFLLAVTVCFGPIFIYALLFKSTTGLFSRWVGSLINYGVLSVLLSVVFGLFISFFESAISAAASPNASGIVTSVVACCLICVVTWFVMKEVPQMAREWGSGVSAGFRGVTNPGRPSSSGGGQGAKGGSAPSDSGTGGAEKTASSSAPTSSSGGGSASGGGSGGATGRSPSGGGAAAAMGRLRYARGTRV